MSLLPIENKIPIPPVELRPTFMKKTQNKVRLVRLEVDQSIYIPGVRHAPSKEIADLKARYGRLYSFRRYYDDEGHVIGVRVWRVK
jgi:hypothetical protein